MAKKPEATNFDKLLEELRRAVSVAKSRPVGLVSLSW